VGLIHRESGKGGRGAIKPGDGPFSPRAPNPGNKYARRGSQARSRIFHARDAANSLSRIACICRLCNAARSCSFGKSEDSRRSSAMMESNAD